MHICFLTLGLRPYEDRLYYKEAWSCTHFADNVTLIGKPAALPEINYPEIEVRSFSPNQSMGAILREVLETAQDVHADIYHLNEPHLLLLLRALRKNQPCKIVYEKRELHGSLIRFYSQSPAIKKYPISWMIDSLEFFGRQFVDGLVFDSDPLYKDYKSMKKPGVLIQNYPRLDLFEDLEHREPEEFVILYQGQIGKTRKLERLLEGFSRFNQKHDAGIIKFVGAVTPPDYLRELKTLSEKLGISHRVEFFPPVPHAQMPEILSNASVGVMALSTDPIITRKVQIKMFEYMLAQLPIITATHPAAEYFIGETNSGRILENPTPQNVANALEYLYNHPEERRAMGQRGQKRVQTEWNWSTMEPELQRFYEQVLES